MKSYPSPHIRNVVLLGHGSAGKTTLAEALLYASGALSRQGRVEEGNTVSDYDPEEIRRHISIYLSLAPCEWNQTKINLMDTPGYADFVGETKSAVCVAEGAVIVLCAVSGVEVGSEQVWKFAKEARLPRLIFINKIERENADFFRTLAQAQELLSPKCLPVQLPLGAQESFEGIVDLVRGKAYLGPDLHESPIPEGLKQQAESYREKVLEAVAETDDALITKYLEGEGLTEEEICVGLRRGTREGNIVPVFVGSALTHKAISPLLDALVSYLPSPEEGNPIVGAHPLTQIAETLPPDPSGPLAALVFKTTADPYLGKLTYLRVYSGTLHSDSHVWNIAKGRDERLGQLFHLRGKTQEPVPFLVAGDMGAVAKLAETSTGDTLGSRDRPLLLPPITFPQPAYSAALYPKTKADLDKMSSALARLCEEDPTLRVTKEPDTGETLLSGLGESHVEISTEKMRRKFGAEVLVDLPKVPYKETITVPMKAEYKHKKQTGGHGQYGHVFLDLQPLPRGTGFEFAEKVVGGVVPKNYIPAVEKGVQETLQEGILARYPVVDVKVTLYDGSYHPVDSSEYSFKVAGSQAFKKGMAQAQPALLEPIMLVRITVPDAFVGDAMSDLNSRRARVLGTVPQDGTSTIEALVPQAEMLRYATVLRSLTQGRGSFTVAFDHYEEVPAHIAQGIIASAKKGE